MVIELNIYKGFNIFCNKFVIYLKNNFFLKYKIHIFGS